MSLDIAFYHKATEEEKAKYWKEYLDMDYSEMDQPFCRTYEFASRCVDAYQNAKTQKEKNQLWHIYNGFARYYCDNDKWKKEKEKNRMCEHCKDILHDHLQGIFNEGDY